MSKQALRRMCAVFTLLVLAIFSAGCSQEAPKEETAVAESAAKSQEQAVEPEEIIYTAEDAGPYEAKKDGHLPQVAWEKTESGLEVTVTVNHEMNADTPHYIMWIKLLDGEDNLLDEKEFQATDEKAVAVFNLPSVPSELKAYEKCNLHGIWLTTIKIGVGPR